jgi:hypothetical protein
MHSAERLFLRLSVIFFAFILFSCASLPEEISDKEYFEKELTVKSGIDNKDVKNARVNFWNYEHYIFDENGHVTQTAIVIMKKKQITNMMEKLKLKKASI